eukprot:CAMPEP_0201659352 /NCGR_PEP_ID=MMETSP0494-20130426/2169_1 /ASSEMBLY_ACC=CAM_ASM_000839 /TAXON_ID=420259 /ORGANISM="Thalassiosira gravida, Strain GMp14c1" /LENGTH=1330 /DNA_ID=CAMNT_0048136815 /DNA_START=37 /DNA_END=4029 /DNA_ORIENTATION=-
MSISKAATIFLLFLHSLAFNDVTTTRRPVGIVVAAAATPVTPATSIATTTTKRATSTTMIMMGEAKQLEGKKKKKKNRPTKHNNHFLIQNSKKKKQWNNKFNNGQQQPPQHSDRRRVIPWVSIIVLMTILFFFRSFAAPFFDPLGEPRQATSSSVYFSLLVILYLWLASVTTLTILPQFSTNYNIVIGMALFFYMVFVSICALLCGRCVIRGLYYFWLFWNNMGSSCRRDNNGGNNSGNNALEFTRMKGVFSALSEKLMVFVREMMMMVLTINRSRDVKVEFSEEVLPQPQPQPQPQQHDNNQKPFPVLIAFQRPFRRLFKRAIFLSAVLCIIYSHCWSRTLSAFDVSRGGGGVCRGVFLPIIYLFPSYSSFVINDGTAQQSISSTNKNCQLNHNITCAHERSIWILWAGVIIGSLFYYAMHEFTGKHHVDYYLTSSRQHSTREMEMLSKSSSSSLGGLDMATYHHHHHGAGNIEIDASMEEEEDDDDHDDDDDIDARRHSSGGDDGSVDNDDKEGNNDPWQSILSTRIQRKFTKKKPEQPRETLPMVSWYSNIVFTTGFDMLVSFKIFLGRFDARKMQLALLLKEKRREMTTTASSDDAGTRIHNKSSSLSSSDSDSIQYPEGVFDFSHCKHHHNQNNNVDNNEVDAGFWFDFVSDCGDGFNSSYQVSRMLAQPTLSVIATTASSSSLSSSSSSSPLSSSKQQQQQQQQPKTRILPRGKLLINGGDLAYPDPTPESYEKRFFRTFEDALPPPPSFRRGHISIRKPALPVKGWNNNTTGNDDEASGRDACVDGDDDAYHRLSSYQGPCAFLVPGNHDWFDGLSTYTRYILSRDWLGGWLMPQRTSYFALKLPQRWWLLGFDLALDDDINIEQFHFFASLAENSMKSGDAAIIVSHVPHWVLNEYENHSNDSERESNLTELIRTHLKGKVKLRLAGDLHHYTRHVPLFHTTKQTAAPGMGTLKKKNTAGETPPTLIVAGGGGAFLHPTHCFRDRIKVGEDDYSRVCAYPNAKVSRRLSWLNLWQFRWRNWRFDVLWAVTHFGICSSLFPLCGVYDDYLEFNPNHNLGYLLLWVFRRVGLLFAQIFVSGRISLLFALIMTGIAYAFTDSSNLKWRTHLGWSLAHAFAHISSALICILFLECMTEFVVNEGLVETQNVGGATNAQSCGTGLATSIYDEYTIHFSHTLEDFNIQMLNATNTTLFRDPPDLFPSCRFDERFYSMASETFSWVYHEAPFLKATLAVFDLLGIIGSTHVDMCDVLCSGGVECTYSNDFLRYQQLDRVTILKYLTAISLYFVIFAVPIAGNIFGTWLAVTLNVFNCQYDEGFSVSPTS